MEAGNLHNHEASMSSREFLTYILENLSSEERQCLMVDEKNRRKTFLVHWPHDNVLSGAMMAKAGFYCVDKSDKVECAFCCGSLNKWEPHDDPMQKHAKLSPFCPIVKETNCGRKEFMRGPPSSEQLHLADEEEDSSQLSGEASNDGEQLKDAEHFVVAKESNDMTLSKAGSYYSNCQELTVQLMNNLSMIAPMASPPIVPNIPAFDDCFSSLDDVHSNLLSSTFDGKNTTKLNADETGLHSLESLNCSLKIGKYRTKNECGTISGDKFSSSLHTREATIEKEKLKQKNQMLEGELASALRKIAALESQLAAKEETITVNKSSMTSNKAQEEDPLKYCDQSSYGLSSPDKNSFSLTNIVENKDVTVEEATQNIDIGIARSQGSLRKNVGNLENAKNSIKTASKCGKRSRTKNKGIDVSRSLLSEVPMHGKHSNSEQTDVVSAPRRHAGKGHSCRRKNRRYPHRKKKWLRTIRSQEVEKTLRLMSTNHTVSTLDRNNNIRRNDARFLAGDYNPKKNIKSHLIKKCSNRKKFEYIMSALAQICASQTALHEEFCEWKTRSGSVGSSPQDHTQAEPVNPEEPQEMPTSSTTTPPPTDNLAGGQPGASAATAQGTNAPLVNIVRPFWVQPPNVPDDVQAIQEIGQQAWSRRTSDSSSEEDVFY